MAHSTSDRPEAGGGATRRDFLDLVAWSAIAVGGVTLVWPFIDSMSPSADVLALSTIEVDVTPIPAGEGITVMWRGKPVFVRNRTAKETEEARDVDVATLRDAQADAERVQKPAWLVVVGICTHLGCVPLGNKTSDPRGDYGGWFCPCHGSQYDTSGRIRQGPAPRNLPIPPYAFTSDSIVRIG